MMRESLKTSRYDFPKKSANEVLTFLPGKKNHANSAERLFWPEEKNINEVELQKKL